MAIVIIVTMLSSRRGDSLRLLATIIQIRSMSLRATMCMFISLCDGFNCVVVNSDIQESIYNDLRLEWCTELL